MGLAQMRYIFSGTRFSGTRDAFKRQGKEIKSTDCVKTAFKQLTLEQAKELINDGPAC